MVPRWCQDGPSQEAILRLTAARIRLGFAELGWDLHFTYVGISYLARQRQQLIHSLFWKFGGQHGPSMDPILRPKTARIRCGFAF